MRRFALMCLALGALALPAAAFALAQSANDGVLVVKNGQAPKGTPVVQLTITGSVIGMTTDQSRIVIDAGPKGTPVEVTGAGAAQPVKQSDTAQQWSSADGFKFRAVGGKFTILIYGTGVNLVAVGTGSVVVQGLPDTPHGDGWFSINGGERLSLPGSPTKQLVLGSDS